MTTLLSCKIWTQTGTNSIDSKSDFVFSFIPTVRGDRCEAVLEAQKAKPAIRCYEVARDSGALKFWDDPEEDIYSMESGKPV